MEDTRTLYLLLTITFLAFISSLFLHVSDRYCVALFSTVSLPVVYSVRYFAQVGEGEETFRFFRIVSKRESLIRDLIAVCIAFSIGYIMYVATASDLTASGLILYTVAFIVVLFLRYMIVVWYKNGARLVDVNNPFIIIAISLFLAVVGFFFESIIFAFLA